MRLPFVAVQACAGRLGAAAPQPPEGGRTRWPGRARSTGALAWGMPVPPAVGCGWCAASSRTEMKNGSFRSRFSWGI